MRNNDFDALKFCTDYNIDYALSGPNISQGNLGINCPFPHLGSKHTFDTEHKGAFMNMSGTYSCWVCGSHSLIDILKALVPEENPINIIRKYNGDISNNYPTIVPKRSPEVDKVYFPGTHLQQRHKEYLENRGYDPDFITRKYKVKGVSREDWYYSERILAPIYLNSELVAVQGRSLYEKEKRHEYDIVWPYKNKPYRKYVNSVKPDNTNAKIVKYKGIYSLKDIIYNLDNSNKDSVIITEGIMDVWRLGDNSCCTFGTKFTSVQVRLLADRFKTVYVLFDGEEEAQENAKKLGQKLIKYGLKVERIVGLKGDPGDMTEHEVFSLKKDLGLL